jgi:hypothetical protein
MFEYHLPSSLIFDIDVVVIKKLNAGWDSLSLEIKDMMKLGKFLILHVLKNIPTF